MNTKLNKYAQGLTTDIPQEHRNSTYLYKSLIRKDVEQTEWLIGLKEKDIAQLLADHATITSDNIVTEDMTSLGQATVLMAGKYGGVIGAPHYNEQLATDIEERQVETECDVVFLKARSDSAKEAFKQLTGETFTPYVKKHIPKVDSSSERQAKIDAMRAKYLTKA